jgi:hypothetical protein
MATRKKKPVVRWEPWAHALPKDEKKVRLIFPKDRVGRLGTVSRGGKIIEGPLFIDIDSSEAIALGRQLQDEGSVAGDPS